MRWGEGRTEEEKEGEDSKGKGDKMEEGNYITIFGGYYTTKLQRVGFIHAMHLVLL